MHTCPLYHFSYYPGCVPVTSIPTFGICRATTVSKKWAHRMISMTLSHIARVYKLLRILSGLSVVNYMYVCSLASLCYSQAVLEKVHIELTTSSG